MAIAKNIQKIEKKKFNTIEKMLKFHILIMK